MFGLKVLLGIISIYCLDRNSDLRTESVNQSFIMSQPHAIFNIFLTFPNSLKCKEEANTNNKLS